MGVRSFTMKCSFYQLSTKMMYDVRALHRAIRSTFSIIHFQLSIIHFYQLSSANYQLKTMYDVRALHRAIRSTFSIIHFQLSIILFPLKKQPTLIRQAVIYKM